jgi:hypothetical protein
LAVNENGNDVFRITNSFQSKQLKRINQERV